MQMLLMLSKVTKLAVIKGSLGVIKDNHVFFLIQKPALYRTGQ